MTAGAEITKDGERLIATWRRPKGPPVVYTYLDRRAGLSWPGPNNPGYFCLFGLLQERKQPTYGPGGSEKSFMFQRALLAEFQHHDLDRLATSLIRVCTDSWCNWVAADMSDAMYSNWLEIAPLLARSRGINVYDVPLPPMTTATNAVRRLNKARAIRTDYEHQEVDKDKISEWHDKITFPLGPQILYPQGVAMTTSGIHTEDKIKPEERHYALAAMYRVIESYKMFPYTKPAPEAFKQKRKGGYG